MDKKLVESFNESILIVDDEEDLRFVLEEQLSSLNVNIISVASAEEALERLQKEKIFLVVCDFSLGGMNGLELCQKCRIDKPLLPFIILTGFADKEMVLEGLRTGVSDVLEKPGDLVKVTPTAKEYLRKRIKEIQIELEEMKLLRDVFVGEAQGLFRGFENLVIKLEISGEPEEYLNKMFRTVHTLKGSAGAFPATEKLSELLHQFEGLLVCLRKKTIKLNAAIIDLLLGSTDLINQLIEEFSGEKPVEPHIFEDVIGRIKQCIRLADDNKNEDTKQQAEDPAGFGMDEEIDEGILVTTDKLTNFMELSGELIVFKNTLNSILKQLLSHRENYRYKQSLEDLSHSVNYISDQIQKQIMDVRKVSFRYAFSKFPRMVRKTAQILNKKVSLEIEGAELGIDKSLALSLSNCIIHILRNSIDHGIESPRERLAMGKDETGKINIACFVNGDTVKISIRDDGRGIVKGRILEKAIEKGIIDNYKASLISDEKIYELLFLPSFSTASEVTTISGRGVGMDVVKSEIAKLNGSIEVKTKPGYFTEFTISVPVLKSVMVEDSILARSGEFLMTIPLASISKIMPSNEANIKNVQGKPTCQHYGKTVPVGFYSEFLEEVEEVRAIENPFTGVTSGKGELLIIIMNKGSYIGMKVDLIIDQLEAVIRPFDSAIERIPGFKGTSVLSDENVAYVVSPEELVHLGLGSHLS